MRVRSSGIIHQQNWNMEKKGINNIFCKTLKNLFVVEIITYFATLRMLNFPPFDFVFFLHMFNKQKSSFLTRHKSRFSRH